MSETVSSETIQSLAAKLADFAEALDDAERTALDLFFLQPSDVEGFSMTSLPAVQIPGGMFDLGMKGAPRRQEYLQIQLENALISSY